MTLFPKTIPYKYNTFTRAKGRVVEGVDTESVFLGSVQPITDKDINSLPVGRQDIGKMKVFANKELPISTEGGATTGAIITWQTKEYEITDKMDYQNDLISHYKYIADLRDKVTV